jgi:hypothetical protein
VADAAPERLEAGRRARCGGTSRWHGGALHGCASSRAERARGVRTCDRYCGTVHGVYVDDRACRRGVWAAGCLV